MAKDKADTDIAATPNPADLKREALKQALPEAISEGKVDLEALKRALGEDSVIDGGERYRLDWVGKSEAYKILQTPTTATFRPRRDQSVNFDTASHVFIEGENLESLKVLQKPYFGKVKLIYIDPPYNTGNDNFVYPDRFQESKKDYLKRINELDDDGALMREGFFRKNSRESGHYHSNWLSMMLPRLYIARNLLHEQGAIFVSCDDNEVYNLRCLMNEIFGEDNFIGQVVVQSNKRGQTYKQLSKTHEYLILYSRSDSFELNELPKRDDELPLKDSKGRFELWELRNRNPEFGKHNRPNLYFPIYVAPDEKDSSGFSKISLTKSQTFCIKALPLDSTGRESCWRWSKRKIEDQDTSSETPTLIAKQKKDGSWNVYEKSRKSTKKPKSIWTETAVISEQGTVELSKYGLKRQFDHPKPVALVKKILQIGTGPDDLVLDFFAGSGTTMEAVLRQNAEDSGNRRSILIQLPEPLGKDSAEFSDIAQVARTRIRAVIDDLKESEDLAAPFPKNEGFKAYSLAPSNFKQWRGEAIESPDELAEQVKLFMNAEKDGADTEAVLYELLLKLGYELTASIETIELDGHAVHAVDEGRLLLLLEGFSESMIEPLIERKPEQIVALDSAFNESDSLKSNLALQCRDNNIRFNCF